MNFTRAIFFTLLLLLPTQLGMHFWLPESLVLGRKIDYLAPTLFITDILLVLFVVGVFIKKILINPKTWTLTLVMAAFLVLFLSNISPLSAYVVTRLLLLTMFVSAVIYYKPKPHEYGLPLFIGSVCVGLLAVLQFVNQQSLGNFLYFFGERSFTKATPGIALVTSAKLVLLRAYATFPHPNVLGGYLATLVPLLLFQLKTKPTNIFRQKYFFILKHAFVAFCFLALALSFSRTAWCALFMGVGVCLYLSRLSGVHRVSRWAKLTVLVLGSIVMFVSFKMASTEQAPFFERLGLARYAIEMTVKHPLFGVGLLRFVPSLPDFDSPPYLLQPVHSIYLLIAAETGLTGFVVFLLFCFFVIRHALRQKKHHLVASISVILFCGLFDHYFITIQQTRLLFVFIIALVFVDDNQNLTKTS